MRIANEYQARCHHCGEWIRMVQYDDFDPLVPLDDDDQIHSITCDDKRRARERLEAARRSIP